MARTLENRFYYLENFQRVLAWIAARYSDLLNGDERAFIEQFNALPQTSRALLVRMVMRKGNLFRASKLRYDEIGCTQEAARPLLELSWIAGRPPLTLEQVFGLLTKPEIAAAFRDWLPNTTARKTEQLDALRAHFTEARSFDEWIAIPGECVYQVNINPLCNRLKLMFFGNCRQDWSEFVLADLEIYKYEAVEFSAASRGFQTRDDVDCYLHLHQCRERFELGEPPESILPEIPACARENDWLESRRQKLLFKIAQHYERVGEPGSALALYRELAFPGARIRAVRVLEKNAQYDQAYALAQTAAQMPENDEEKQQLLRLLPRLHRKLGLPKISAAPAPVTDRIDLVLPQQAGYSVEWLVRDYLAQDSAPVHYVENTLINSLFGLLCWEAIFAAVPGAFFQPFHAGPADLHSADFYHRREREFTECLSQLDSGEYLHTINRNFIDKAGILSPFVFWEILTDELRDLALTCIPAIHLKKWFERILLDIKANRAGFPDLIQFWPAEKRYRMIEVKGPGDRLQDNQLRLLGYCAAHAMPVAVCYVQWAKNTR